MSTRCSFGLNSIFMNSIVIGTQNQTILKKTSHIVPQFESLLDRNYVTVTVAIVECMYLSAIVVLIISILSFKI